MDQQFKNKTKTIFQEIYTENKWFKAGVVTIGSLALIYFLGQSANILASSVRGFRNLGNAWNGK